LVLLLSNFRPMGKTQHLRLGIRHPLTFPAHTEHGFGNKGSHTFNDSPCTIAMPGIHLPVPNRSPRFRSSPSTRGDRSTLRSPQADFLLHKICDPNLPSRGATGGHQPPQAKLAEHTWTTLRNKSLNATTSRNTGSDIPPPKSARSG